MNEIIEFEGKNYSINIARALELGIAKEQSITNIQQGDVFCNKVGPCIVLHTYDKLHWGLYGLDGGLQPLANIYKTEQEVLYFVNRYHYRFCGNINNVVKEAIKEIVQRNYK